MSRYAKRLLQFPSILFPVAGSGKQSMRSTEVVRPRRLILHGSSFRLEWIGFLANELSMIGPNLLSRLDASRLPLAPVTSSCPLATVCFFESDRWCWPTASAEIWRPTLAVFGHVDAPRFQAVTVSTWANREYPTEYDGIVKAMQKYIEGSKQGKSELMRPAFHPDASFFGYAGGQLAIGTSFLFDWIDKNGPAPAIEHRIVSVDILESIAVVRLEVAGWSGALAGSGIRMFDFSSRF